MRPQRDLKPDDIVLIKNEATKRNMWPLGRVITVKLSKDNHVRSATIRVARIGGDKQTILERPISELVLLLPSI